MAGELSRDTKHGAYHPQVHLLSFETFFLEFRWSDFAESGTELGCILVVGEN